MVLHYFGRLCLFLMSVPLTNTLYTEIGIRVILLGYRPCKWKAPFWGSLASIFVRRFFSILSVSSSQHPHKSSGRTVFAVAACVTFLLALSCSGVGAQTISTGLSQAAQTILSEPGCGGWPPALVKAKDVGKSAQQLSGNTGAHQQKYLDNLYNALLQNLQLPANQPVTEYDASLIRLLDASTSSNALNSLNALDNTDLLGLANILTPDNLATWGLTTATIRYNCSSLLSALASANTGLSLPLFSIQAGAQLQLNMTSDQTATFMAATIQSPFDLMYDDTSSDYSKRLLASLQGALWLATHPSQNQHVKVATVLSVEFVQSSSDTSAMLANAAFGAKLTFFSASASFKDQVAKGLTSSVHSFKTYIYNDTAHTSVGPYPSFADLLASAQRNLPVLLTPGLPIVPGVKQTASAQIVGFPPALCTSTWTISSANTYFPGPVLTMTPKDPSGTGLPVCQVSVDYTLVVPPADTALDSNQSLMADPKLTITSTLAPSLVLGIHFDRTLIPANKPVFHESPSVVNWQHLPLTASSNEALAWTIRGSVDIPTGTLLTGYKLNPSGFKCVYPANGSALNVPMLATFAPAALTADNLVAPISTLTTSTDASPTLILSVIPNQITPNYNPDPTQLNPQSCVITGDLTIQTTIGGIAQNTKVSINSNSVNFPNQMPGISIAGTICAAPSTAGGSYVLANVAASGLNCSLNGSGLNAVSEINLRSTSNPVKPMLGPVAVTPASNSLINLTFPAALLKSIIDPQYSFVITDNTAAHNIIPLAGTLNVQPLPTLSQAPPAITAASTQSAFSVTMNGANLAQVVQINLRKAGVVTDTVSSSVITSASSVAASFSAANLAPGSYEIMLVTDKTAGANVLVDSGVAMQIN
jgi:hypothetical protein